LTAGRRGVCHTASPKNKSITVKSEKHMILPVELTLEENSKAAVLSGIEGKHVKI